VNRSSNFKFRTDVFGRGPPPSPLVCPSTHPSDRQCVMRCITFISFSSVCLSEYCQRGMIAFSMRRTPVHQGVFFTHRTLGNTRHTGPDNAVSTVIVSLLTGPFLPFFCAPQLASAGGGRQIRQQAGDNFPSPSLAQTPRGVLRAATCCIFPIFFSFLLVAQAPRGVLRAVTYHIEN